MVLRIKEIQTPATWGLVLLQLQLCLQLQQNTMVPVDVDGQIQEYTLQKQRNMVYRIKEIQQTNTIYRNRQIHFTEYNPSPPPSHSPQPNETPHDQPTVAVKQLRHLSQMWISIWRWSYNPGSSLGWFDLSQSAPSLVLKFCSAVLFFLLCPFFSFVSSN